MPEPGSEKKRGGGEEDEGVVPAVLKWGNVARAIDGRRRRRIG